MNTRSLVLPSWVLKLMTEKYNNARSCFFSITNNIHKTHIARDILGTRIFTVIQIMKYQLSC